MMPNPPEIIPSIASQIGVTTGEVEEFLELSKELEILYRGIRRPEDIPSIESGGIKPKPLTPEGKCSFWTTGLRTFVNRTRKCEGMATLDTPWFDYGVAAMVLTDRKSVQRYGNIEWRESDEIRIPFTVPREAITIAKYRPGCNSRESRRPEECRMLRTLLNYLRNYTNGIIIPAMSYVE